MKHQLQTIRSELTSLHGIVGDLSEALTALSELEAMAGEPVATVTSETGNPDISMSWWHEPALPVGTKLYTTPPAHQGDVVVSWDEQRTRILGVTRQDEDGRILKVIAEAPAQQPQYEAGDMASAAAQGFRDGVASVAQQPQAEAAPMSQPNRLIAYSAAAKLRELGYQWDEEAEAWVPQQAEASEYERGRKAGITQVYDSMLAKQAEAVVGTKTWYEDGKMVTQYLTAADIYKPAPQQAEAVPEGYRIVPDWKGYALLGSGRYLINHAANYDPELGAELIITLATEKDREGGRKIGESRPNAEDPPPVQPEEMVIRIGFLNGDALFALEDQLADVRKVLEAAGKAAPQQAEAVPSDVVRDAERLDWLIDGAGRRIAIDSFGGQCRIVDPTASIVVTDWYATKREAIDAAMAQGAKT